jgi:hypothetical protein
MKPMDPTDPLYHPAIAGLNDAAAKAREFRAKQVVTTDHAKEAAGSGKKLGRLSAWVKATRAGKNALSAKWIEDDAKAHADAKAKEEQDKKDSAERAKQAIAAIAKVRKS